MSAPTPGYFYDAYNSIKARIDAGPSAVLNFDAGPLVLDFKPTTQTNTVITGHYGAESVKPGIGVRLLQTGGGMQRIDVPFWFRRFNRGDGEWFLVTLLKTLGRTDLGELTVNGKTYTNCWFVGGDGNNAPTWHTEPDGQVGASSYRKDSADVKGTLRFVRGTPASSALASPSIAAPLPLPGLATGANRGDYWAVNSISGAVKMGRFCDLVEVSTQRTLTYNTIPRCDGVRIKGRGHTQAAIAAGIDYRRGRRMTLRFRGYVMANPTNEGVPDPVGGFHAVHFDEARTKLEQRFNKLHFDLRSSVWTLAGNGNVFYDCHLRSMTADDDDQAINTLGFSAEFDHEYNEVVTA